MKSDNDYLILMDLTKLQLLATAGRSSGLRSRLRKQRSWVQIAVVGRGLRDEQLHLSWLFILVYYYQYNLHLADEIGGKPIAV
jgi:hypothetical protein